MTDTTPIPDDDIPAELSEIFASPALQIWQQYVDAFFPLFMEAATQLDLPGILDELTGITQEIQTWGDETIIHAHDMAVGITSASIDYFKALQGLLDD